MGCNETLNVLGSEPGVCSYMRDVFECSRSKANYVIDRSFLATTCGCGCVDVHSKVSAATICTWVARAKEMTCALLS